MSGSSTRFSRRRFLAQASAGAAAWSSRRAARGATGGANDRLAIGVIGTGNRGLGTLIPRIAALAKSHNVAVTAVCDVWRVNLEKAATKVEQAFGRRPLTFTRFGDLLTDGGVDAVMIATPDFAHTPIMIAAIQAGKDVYCEKPMSLTIEEANEALDLARAHDRVVQVGTQNRSNPVYMAARDFLATGELGQVTRITASVNFNHARWLRKYDDCLEKDVDWEAYLFNRPAQPFDPKLLRLWHLYKMCTNGLAGLWSCHYVDAMHLMTGARYPRRAAALGDTYVWKQYREHSDVFHAVWDYPEGFLFDWAMSLTNSAGNYWRVHGTEGTLSSDNGFLGPHHWIVSREGGRRESKVQNRNIEGTPWPGSTGDLVTDHVANWLDCIRTRRRPNADIAFGHQHAVATIMAAAALHEGRHFVYDARARQMRPA